MRTFQRQKNILPGVGAFDHSMAQLAEKNSDYGAEQRGAQRRIPIWASVLAWRCAAKRAPCRLAGSTLGEALSGPGTSPGATHGLGRCICARQPAAASGEELRFYFVPPSALSAMIRPTAGAGQLRGRLVAAFQRENLFGMQFHPEKSHRFGMELMRRFVELDIA